MKIHFFSYKDYTLRYPSIKNKPLSKNYVLQLLFFGNPGYGQGYTFLKQKLKSGYGYGFEVKFIFFDIF